MKAAFAMKVMKAASMMKAMKAKQVSRDAGAQTIGSSLPLLMRVEALGYALGLADPFTDSIHRLRSRAGLDRPVHVLRFQHSYTFMDDSVSEFEREFWARYDVLPPNSTAAIPHFDRAT
jgi:hypothetical protein